MRYLIIILLLLPFVGQSQTKWRQIERSLTKWNIPAAYDSIPGQAGYAGKWIALTALLDSLGIDSIGGGGGVAGIDSTIIAAGYGITVNESPANTWTVSADTSKLATQHDISGFVDGTGTATRPAFWQDSNTLTSDFNLDWDNTNKRLLIGPNTALTSANKLEVVGTSSAGQYIAWFENEANLSNGGISIFGNNFNTAFIGLNSRAATTNSVIINNINSNTAGGASYINTSINGTGDAYFLAQKENSTAWSLGMKQSNSYAGRFTISESSTLTAAGERFSIATGGVVRIKSLDTDGTAPTVTGTTRAVITDGNGDLSFTTFPTAIDSTIVAAGYGITVNESPSNTWTVSADTSKLATLYDVSQVDQSATNELQKIDTFQIFDTNKLRISLENDGEPAKVVTLPSFTTIDSTIVTGGYGIQVTESPANTFTVSADTAALVTVYDLSLVDQSSTNEIQVIDTFEVFDTNKLRISLSMDGQPAKVVTLPTGGGGGGGGIDSTVVVAGYGLLANESPANTWNIAADSTKLATQYDISGFVDGTGTATRPAIWSDSNTLTTDSNLDWNNTDKRLIIGTGSIAINPNKLTVVGTPSSAQAVMTVESEGNNATTGIFINGEQTSQTFTGVVQQSSTSGAVISTISNNNGGTNGSATQRIRVSSSNGDAYYQTSKTGGQDWSFGLKQSQSNSFMVTTSDNMNTAQARMSISTSGVMRINSLDTDAAAPSTSGTTRAVITDGNGDLSFTTFPTAIDSTVVSAGYGLTATESPANTFTVSADTSKLATLYDVSQAIQKIDTFQVFDTNKLRISLTGDGEPAKVVTLPTGGGGGGGIDSTIVTAGWGMIVNESPANTFTVTADSSKIATQYDLSLVDQSATNELQTIDTFQIFDTNKLRISLSQDGQPAKVVTLPSGAGTVTSIATTAPISGGTITTTGTIGLNYDSGTLTLSGSNLAARNGSSIWNADQLQNTTIKSPLNPTTGNVLTYTASNQWEAQAPSAGTTNLTFTGSSSPFTLNSDTGTDVTIAAGDNITLTRSSNQLTVSATTPVVETWADVAGDIISWGSTGTFNSGKQVGIGTLNAARLLDVNGDAQLRGAIYNSSNSAGSSGQVLTSGGSGAWTWATPADGSATNELQTLSTNGTAGNITISSGNTITLNVNDADASTTNELQTLSHTSNSTSHTVTLSNSGGSLILTEGAGINLTTSSNNVTIASTIPYGSAELAITSDLTLTGVTTTPIMVDFGATDAITNNYGTTNLIITYSGSFDPDATGNLKFAVYKNGSNIGYKSELNVWTQGTHDGMPFSKRFKTSANLNDYFELYIIDTGNSFNQITLKNVVFLVEIVD